MRLYTRTGAVALDDPEFGHFDADERGGFDFPDDLSDRLHRHHNPRTRTPMWETELERAQRRAAEDLERRRDPATLQALVEQLLQQARSDPADGQEPTRPTKRAPKKATPTE